MVRPGSGCGLSKGVVFSSKGLSKMNWQKINGIQRNNRAVDSVLLSKVPKGLFGKANDKGWCGQSSTDSTGTSSHFKTVTTCMGTDWKQLLIVCIYIL